MPDETQLTDQTKAEQEYGRKMAKQNAAAYERAVKAREAEVPEGDETQKGTNEGFPVAKGQKPQKGE